MKGQTVSHDGNDSPDGHDGDGPDGHDGDNHHTFDVAATPESWAQTTLMTMTKTTMMYGVVCCAVRYCAELCCVVLCCAACGALASVSRCSIEYRRAI